MKREPLRYYRAKSTLRETQEAATIVVRLTKLVWLAACVAVFVLARYLFF